MPVLGETADVVADVPLSSVLLKVSILWSTRDPGEVRFSVQEDVYVFRS